jgi:hypothetical protein
MKVSEAVTLAEKAKYPEAKKILEEYKALLGTVMTNKEAATAFSAAVKSWGTHAKILDEAIKGCEKNDKAMAHGRAAIVRDQIMELKAAKKGFESKPAVKDAAAKIIAAA